ncbi:MAG: hypothetical protein P8J66_02815, partial [Verrucomicrobiota bacterium]|nr:hypothetical protein [Verrucomicrobiota bacterium]
DILAFVSWVGFPEEGEGMSLFSGAKPPPFFIYDPSNAAHWKSAMDKGFIGAVARSKISSKNVSPQAEPDTPRQFFDNSYQLITHTAHLDQGAQ